jgi:ribosomal protein S18 acetylase RimI-like enzyme
VPPPLRAAAAHGIGYRALVEADLPFVAALYASTRQQELAQTGWPQAAIDAFLLSQHEAQHAHYVLHYAGMEWLIILDAAGAPIGRLYLAEWPSEFRIVDIALLPEARGRGIGRSVLEDVLALAREAGKPVSIHVEKNNPARHLYERLGFRSAEDKGVYDLMRTADPGPT